MGSYFVKSSGVTLFLLFIMVSVQGDDEFVDLNEITSCGGELRSPQGIITSPNYPHPYPNLTDCTWIIFPPPFTAVLISMKDMDVASGLHFDDPSSCTHNWLSLPSDSGEGYFHICGKQIIEPPLKVTSKKVIITFKSSFSLGHHRGFKLEYRIVCGPRKVQCNPLNSHCYSPISEKCDGIRQCPDGEDEIGCDIICEEDHRLCSNKRCAHNSFWCDGIDNCGDNSDEENCMGNSIISLTIMGSLMCGLCVVLVVLCSLRIYTRRQISPRNYSYQISAIDDPRVNIAHSLTHPPLVDEEFFHREPPPPYAVAVSQSGCGIQHNEIMQEPPPYHLFSQTTMKMRTPPSSETSNQSSPSRDSVTSSSYLSNEGNEPLIDI